MTNGKRPQAGYRNPARSLGYVPLTEAVEASGLSEREILAAVMHGEVELIRRSGKRFVVLSDVRALADRIMLANGQCGKTERHGPDQGNFCPTHGDATTLTIGPMFFLRLEFEVKVTQASIHADLLGCVISLPMLENWFDLPGHHKSPAVNWAILTALILRRPLSVELNDGKRVPYALVQKGVIHVLHEHGFEAIAAQMYAFSGRALVDCPFG